MEGSDDTHMLSLETVSLLVFKVTLPVALSFPPERKSLGYHMDSCSLLHSVVP